MALMEDWFDHWPETNYFDEFVEKAEDFIIGRKVIFTLRVRVEGEHI